MPPKRLHGKPTTGVECDSPRGEWNSEARALPGAVIAHRTSLSSLAGRSWTTVHVRVKQGGVKY